MFMDNNVKDDKKVVLMIDDEESFCTLVKMRLQVTGKYKVHVAYNGKEGLKLASKVQPSIIILDIRMPYMDGFDVLKNLKEDERTVSIPVIMLTAMDDPMSKNKAMGLYNEDYLVKPVSLEALEERLDKFFGFSK